jgi:hypothetical protein
MMTPIGTRTGYPLSRYSHVAAATVSRATPGAGDTAAVHVRRAGSKQRPADVGQRLGFAIKAISGGHAYFQTIRR